MKGNIRVMCRLRPYIKSEKRAIPIEQMRNPPIKVFEDCFL